MGNEYGVFSQILYSTLQKGVLLGRAQPFAHSNRRFCGKNPSRVQIPVRAIAIVSVTLPNGAISYRPLLASR